MLHQWLDRLRDLKAWQVAAIFGAIGFTVFFSGLTNPFQNDDIFQIVNNPPVHAIKNLPEFFRAGTYWDGQQLSGKYYRPLMTTVFSLIYAIVGAKPVAFHVVQLTIYIASAFLLYLVFRQFLKRTIAIFLALIFLIHPLNSQIVYSIATMQDVLLFFFGILAIYLLIRSTAAMNLWTASGSLLLALLSKESGVVFIMLALLYLFLFHFKRLFVFVGTLILPVIFYLVLKSMAVGLSGRQLAAPIDNLNLAGRLLTAPSIVLFYIEKFIFPWKLASTYYWVYPQVTLWHTLLPLLVDLAAAGAILYMGVQIKHKLPGDDMRIFIFFAAWTVLSIIPYLQIIPLDMTVCETWFYTSVAGLLGTLGIAMRVIRLRFATVWLLLPIVLLLSILGARSALRGADYRSQYILARHDVAASQGDYSALVSLGQYDVEHGRYLEAAAYAKQSIAVYPTVANYNLLGVALEQKGDYSGAAKAYTAALKYNNLSTIYENLGLILVVYSDPATTNRFFQKALRLYPSDFKLWVYLAVFEASHGSPDIAEAALQRASKYGNVPQPIYAAVVTGQPLALPLLGKTLIVQ